MNDKKLDERDREAQRLEEKKRQQELKEKQSSLIMEYFKNRAFECRQDPDQIEYIIDDVTQEFTIVLIAVCQSGKTAVG